MAAPGVSIFAVTTYDTDYLLVHEAKVEQAIAILKRAGHQLTSE